MNIGVIKEERPSRIAAFFNSEVEVKSALKGVLESDITSSEHLDIVSPNDPKLLKTLKPETQGIKEPFGVRISTLA